MKTALEEAGAFLLDHRVHLLLLIPAALLYTVVHEAAHAAAVLLQGGHLKDFAWLPSQGEWGHISYVFQPGASYSPMAISLAPYALVVLLASAACIIAALFGDVRRPWAAVVFIWIYCIPLADVAYATLGYMTGVPNDLFRAFGPPDFIAATCAAFALTSGTLVTYWLHRRLYGINALKLPAFSLLGALAFILITVLDSIAFPLSD